MWASGAVDVRDVADTHLRALDLTESFGQRVPVNERWMWFRDMAETIKPTVPGRRIVTRVALRSCHSHPGDVRSVDRDDPARPGQAL